MIIANYGYFPYSALTKASRAKAQREGETMVVTPAGFATKALNHSGEWDITAIEYMEASKLHVECIRHHHRDRHADALQAHVAIVLSLTGKQGSTEAAG